MQESARLCAVCHKAPAKYICPSCKVAYCSKECYNNHNPKCTERFYERLVLDEMSLRQQEDKEKNQAAISAMLKRANEEIVEPLDLYGEEVEGLEEVAERLEKGEDVSLDSLPPSLREAFLRDVANGEMKRLVPVWKPWWLMTESRHNAAIQSEMKPLIEEIHTDSSEEEEEEEEEEEGIPCVRKFLADKSYGDVPLPAVVSSSISYNAVEVVFFYCLLSRAYNGEYDECRAEIVEGIVTMSGVLGRAAVFSSMAECVASIRSNERLSPFASSLASGQAVNQLETHKQGAGSVLENTFADVLGLLDLPHFWIDALAHLVVLIHTHGEKAKRRKALFAAERKCAFFTTYFRKMEAEPFWLLHKELETVMETQTKTKAPRRSVGRRIEEIT